MGVIKMIIKKTVFLALIAISSAANAGWTDYFGNVFGAAQDKISSVLEHGTQRLMEHPHCLAAIGLAGIAGAAAAYYKQQQSIDRLTAEKTAAIDVQQKTSRRNIGLETRQQEFVQQNNTLSNTIHSRDQILASKQIELDALKAELSIAQQELQAQTKSSAELNANIMQLNKELRSTKDHNYALQQKLKIAEEQSVQLQQKLLENKELLVKADQKYKTLQDTFYNTLNALQESEYLKGLHSEADSEDEDEEEEAIASLRQRLLNK